MTFIERRLNKWIVKSIFGSGYLESDTENEKNSGKKGLTGQIKDFLKTGVKEIQKDTKKVIGINEE